MSLQLRSLTKVYRTKGETVVAVNGVSLSLPEHGFVIILGRSGCGKTTLLNLLGKMDMPTGGMALYNGRSIYSMPEYNQKVGFVFQEIHLFPFMSAKRNIELAQDYAGVHARPAEDYLRLVGMEEFAAQKVRLLSGGEQQRVAVARMLAAEPQIVLADEPTGALDEDNAETVFRILQEVAKTRLVIAVTHDADSAAHYADLLLHMTDGKLTVMRDPLSASEPETPAAFAGAANEKADNAEVRATSLSGTETGAASAGAADGQANAASAGAASAGGDAQASGRHGKTAKAAANRRLPNKKQKSPSHFVQNLQMARAIASRSKLKSILYVLMLALLLTALLAAATVLYTDTANVTWHRFKDNNQQWIQIYCSERNYADNSSFLQMKEEAVNYINDHTKSFYSGCFVGNSQREDLGVAFRMSELPFSYTEGGAGEAVLIDTYAAYHGIGVGDVIEVISVKNQHQQEITTYATVTGIVNTSALPAAEAKMFPSIICSMEYMQTQGWSLMNNLTPVNATICADGLSHWEFSRLIGMGSYVRYMEESAEGLEVATEIEQNCSDFIGSFSELRGMLLGVSGAMLLVIIIFSVYFVRGHIETNQRMLAILQVLGAKQKDFVAMFLLQFGCMLLIALLIAACAMAFIFPQLPELLIPNIAENVNGIVYFFVNIYYIPALLCPLLTLPATLIPLRNIHRKAPVDLLRR